MTDDTASVWLWQHGELVALPAEELPSSRWGRIAVADSWLVEDGLVRALPLHRARFGETASRHLPDAEIERFWTAALATIPAEGAWFPRFEVVVRSASSADPAPGMSTSGTPPLLIARIRPAPVLRDTAVLATHHAPDPRLTPSVKGPDIEALLAARDEHSEHGANDAVILSESGHIVDGTTSAVLWWRNGTLLAPSSSLARVDSITAKSLKLVAHATGSPIGEEFATPRDLDGCEVWAVNALHGIRLVTTWIDGPAVRTTDPVYRLWRDRLAALRRPLPGAV
jgi:branched-subunit amino acid aminotransferase/4-amino-4-deoxychorismate lyase